MKHHAYTWLGIAIFRRYYVLSFDEIETKSSIVYEKRA
jgi:hypothetical protein